MPLSAIDISLKLGGTAVLKNIDVVIEPGKIVAVVGPNGAGKSSLLRLLSGTWRASRGRVVLNDRELAQWPIRDIAQTLAVMSQYSNLTFAFTSEEIVMLGRTPHAAGRKIDIDITAQALARVDASHLARRLYTELSGGEKQRVHFARSLAQVWMVPPARPRYLLLDEPTASFDLAHQQMTLAVLREFAEDGVGVLVVLHDLNLAAQLADAMVLMKDGRIVTSGEPQAVMRADVIDEVFGVDVTIVAHPRDGTPLAIL